MSSGCQAPYCHPPYPPHAWGILSILPKAGEYEENGENGLDEARLPDILLLILLIIR